jgi:hypothetical protein
MATGRRKERIVARACGARRRYRWAVVVMVVVVVRLSREGEMCMTAARVEPGLG